MYPLMPQKHYKKSTHHSHLWMDFLFVESILNQTAPNPTWHKHYMWPIYSQTPKVRFLIFYIHKSYIYYLKHMLKFYKHNTNIYIFKTYIISLYMYL